MCASAYGFGVSFHICRSSALLNVWLRYSYAFSYSREYIYVHTCRSIVSHKCVNRILSFAIIYCIHAHFTQANGTSFLFDVVVFFYWNWGKNNSISTFIQTYLNWMSYNNDSSTTCHHISHSKHGNLVNVTISSTIPKSSLKRDKKMKKKAVPVKTWKWLIIQCKMNHTSWNLQRKSVCLFEIFQTILDPIKNL